MCWWSVLQWITGCSEYLSLCLLSSCHAEIPSTEACLDLKHPAVIESLQLKLSINVQCETDKMYLPQLFLKINITSLCMHVNLLHSNITPNPFSSLPLLTLRTWHQRNKTNNFKQMPVSQLRFSKQIQFTKKVNLLTGQLGICCFYEYV